jgi:hypothetical protein
MKRTPLKRRTPLRAKKRSAPKAPKPRRTGRTIRITVLDNLFSLYIRTRDGFQCQRCKAVYEKNSRRLHNSHFVGRGAHSVRFDPANCDALCHGCHSLWEGLKAAAYRDFKIDQLGQERYDALVLRGRVFVKIDRPAMAVQIQQWIAELTEHRRRSP